MHVLAAITFYGTAIFGLGGGLVFCFRMGRLGLIQVRNLTLAMPAAQGLSREDYLRLADVAGIPTSVPDLLLSLTLVGWVKSAGSCFVLLSRSPSLAFAGALIGGFLGRLWYTVSLPLLAVYVILGLNGVKYWPQWLSALGVTETTFELYAGVAAGYFGAYFLGKSVGSPTRAFYDARTSYERLCRDYGYWFDNRHDGSHYKGCEKSLRRTLSMFDELLAKVGRDADSPLARQRAMTLHYQRALALATLSRYEQARDALKEVLRLKALLKGSELLDPDAGRKLESQVLFLDGELLLAQGERERARERFERSKAIDAERGDSVGIDINKKRLAAI